MRSQYISSTLTSTCSGVSNVFSQLRQHLHACFGHHHDDADVKLGHGRKRTSMFLTECIDSHTSW